MAVSLPPLVRLGLPFRSARDLVDVCACAGEHPLQLASLKAVGGELRVLGLREMPFADQLFAQRREHLWVDVYVLAHLVDPPLDLYRCG